MMEKSNKKLKRKSRYISIEKGIRKDNILKKYLAYKKLKGILSSEYFDNISDCRLWLKTYIPPEVKNPVTKNFDPDCNARITFHEVWEMYKDLYLSSDTTYSTYHSRLKKEAIFEYLFGFRMRELTPKIITEWLREEKNKCRAETKKSRRFNFNDDLKALKAFFNWWKEESEDVHFNNPILKKHKKIGQIKETPYREKKMDREELLMFFYALGNKTLWQDLAHFQFYIAGRIQEPTAIQVKRIDLRARRVLIKEVAVWGNDKKMAEIKSLPKNNEPEPVHLNDTLLEIAVRRIGQAMPVTVGDEQYSLIFHVDGQAISYRQVQYHYRMALEKCGLSERFSGTHIMRHSMGTMTRSVTGNLDSAQAVTRHKDAKVAQQYSKLDYELQKKAANAVENFMSAQPDARRTGQTQKNVTPRLKLCRVVHAEKNPIKTDT